MDKEFLVKLSTFFRERFSVSEEFCQEIEACEDSFDLGELLEGSLDFSNIFAEKLQSEKEDLALRVQSLNSEMDSLYSEISSLEHELSDKFKPTTLWEKEKVELFISNQERFTPVEFEMILNSEAIKFIKINFFTVVPNKEVICINEYGACLVGWLSKRDGDFYCESENELMYDVTHFAYIPKLSET